MGTEKMGVTVGKEEEEDCRALASSGQEGHDSRSGRGTRVPTDPAAAVCELLVCGQWWLLPNRGRGIALEMRPNLVGICVWVGEGGLQVSSF